MALKSYFGVMSHAHMGMLWCFYRFLQRIRGHDACVGSSIA